MSNKFIKTRIKNRVDLLTKWSTTNPELLPGEIAVASVTTQQIDPTTGNVVNVPAVLIKVGEDGKKFNELPWLSAKAADVYDWAKKSDIKDVKVKVITDIDEQGNDVFTEDELGNWLKTINDRSLANTESIAGIQDIVAGGIHFAGIAKEDTNFAKTAAATDTVTISIKDGASYKTHTLVIGDIVIKEKTAKEYIWTGTAWQELGDQTLIGTLETKVSGLDVDPTASGTATEFISSLKKDTDGKLKATKANLPTASTTVAGITTLGVTGAAPYDDVFGDLGLEPRIADIEDNFVKYIANSDTTGTLSIGKDSTAADYIIFDCGGASI